MSARVGTVLLANDAAAILACKRYKVQTNGLTEVLHDALIKGVIKAGEEYEAILNSAKSRALPKQKGKG